MKPQKCVKYGNVKTSVDGLKFDSKKEAKRYQELKLLQRAGEIERFDHQVEFILRPGFTDNEGKRIRPRVYVADFVLYLKDGTRIIEDVKGGKGTQTRLFQSKWNDMKYLFRDDKTVKLRIV